MNLYELKKVNPLEDVQECYTTQGVCSYTVHPTNILYARFKLLDVVQLSRLI